MSVTIPVVKTPDVLDGKPRVEGTRIGVQQIGSLVREHGWSRDTVTAEFDLSPDEIDAALTYYDANPEEMASIADGRAATVEGLREGSRATE